MKLSVVIPAYNEQAVIEETIVNLVLGLEAESINYEILVVNDNSTDGTEGILSKISDKNPKVRIVNNPPPNGFGYAIRRGLENYTGDAVAIYMADASDSPTDLVRFFKMMVTENVDCVFGTRFQSESSVIDYPKYKLFVNRLANTFIRILFAMRYNDVTNAFKLYRRNVIDGVQPVLSNHFNITVELPLKAIIRGYTYIVLPNDWRNRAAGDSKLYLKEMGSRYLFIVLYCFLEKCLSKKDYHRIETERVRLTRQRLE